MAKESFAQQKGTPHMKISNRRIVGPAFLALGLAALGTAWAQDKGTQTKVAPPPGLALSSSSFKDGDVIPEKYTQAAGPAAVSPKLEWTNIPNGTVSFAMIMHDPDVALQKKTDDVLHWMVFNIPGTTHEMPEGVPAGTAMLPDGTMQAKNLRGAVGFMGPGAPAGTYHHYTFELFALDTKLDLNGDATRADVLNAMQGHILGKGVLVGRFHR
jgi:Raf kinase inhibitor-like YbhB/YbcL family protein